MVDAGWLEEVRVLLDRGVSRQAPGFQSLGYREMLRVVDGESSLEEAIAATVRATRRYAKRQRTWFRRWPEIDWLPARPTGQALVRALEVVRRRRDSERTGSGR